jgi:NADH dehydrogenase
MAGQIGELARDTLPNDFRATDPRRGRILLVETADRILPGFPPELSQHGADSLRELCVTPLTRQTVVGIDEDGVDIQAPGGSTQRIATRTVVWAAGVTASPLAGALAHASGAELDRSGRVTVEPDLTLPAHPEVMAVGDMVRVRDRDTGSVRTLPGLAPVAMQQGRYAGRAIDDRLAGRPTPPWRYFDKGNLATIGRGRAVAQIRRLRFAGLLAWIVWLVVHIRYLVGFENRTVVFVRWAYSFMTRNRGARLIT